MTTIINTHNAFCWYAVEHQKVLCVQCYKVLWFTMNIPVTHRCGLQRRCRSLDLYILFIFIFTNTHSHIKNNSVCAGFPNSGWTTLSVTPDVSRKNLLQASHLFNPRVMAEIHHTHTHTHTHLIHKVGQTQTLVRWEQSVRESRSSVREAPLKFSFNILCH